MLSESDPQITTNCRIAEGHTSVNHQVRGKVSPRESGVGEDVVSKEAARCSEQLPQSINLCQTNVRDIFTWRSRRVVE